MTNHPMSGRRFGRGVIRTLARTEMPLLRDHLLRLDAESRHDRFNGAADDGFIERYAAKCEDDGTAVVAYLEDGAVRGAAELHPPAAAPDDLPEVAFSVERNARRQGLGSALFELLIAEARAKSYPTLRITTGAQNDAMRALARKFGARLTFRSGETAGTIDLTESMPAAPEAAAPAPLAPVLAPLEMARAMVAFNREYWDFALKLYGIGRAA